MRLSDLANSLGVRIPPDYQDIEIKGVAYNSKEINKDYLFVAIEGHNSDGHNFIDEAISRGAEVIVYEHDHQLNADQKSKGIIFIPFENTRIALSRISSKFYQDPSHKLKCIGVTGTNGKTTVTYLLESILRCVKKYTGVIGTVNYRFKGCQIPATNTTPSSLDLQRLLYQMKNEGIEYVIMEVSSHALDQGRTKDIEFKVAVFTNLTQDHLDYHKDLESYFKAKEKLFLESRTEPIAVINRDDPYGRRLIGELHKGVLTYGLEQGVDIKAEDIRLGLRSSQFQVKTPHGEIKVKTHLLGLHNVYNILATIGAALSLGVNLEAILEGVNKLEFVPGRLQPVQCGQKFHVFVDYAHTDDALKNVLSYLSNIQQSLKLKGKIIIVFGCGGNRDRLKRPKMGAIASELADKCIITNDNPRNEDPDVIVRDIQKGITRDNCEVVLDRKKAIKKALGLARDNDIVIIAGKGHENYQIFKGKTVHFDDVEIAIEILGADV